MARRRPGSTRRATRDERDELRAMRGGSGGVRAPTKKKNRGQGHVGPDGPRYQRSPLPLNAGNPYQPAPRKPRFGDKQTVKGGVAQRARRRAKAVGGVKGVNVKDGITGREARKIKRKWNRQGRPSPGGGGGTGGNRGGGGNRPPVSPFQTQVDALAQLQYGPQERQLADQRAIEAQRGVNQNAWYNDLYQRSLQAAQATQAGAMAAQQMAYGQANQNFATDQTANQGLLQQQNQQAAIRGTATDPMLAQQMQRGAQVRQQQQTQFGNLAGQLGQNQAGYAGARTIQATEQGIQAQQDTQARQRKVESLAQELLADKGAFKVKTTMDLKEARHKRRLENKAFGLDVAQEQFDQADARADNRRMSKSEQRQQREARSRIRDRKLDNRRADRSLSLSERKEQRMRDQDLADDGKLNGSSGGSGKGSFTPTQVRSGRKSLRNLVGRVKNNVDPPDSVDPLLARAAVQIADNGGVTPALARKIKRQYGFMPKVKRMSIQESGRGGLEQAEGWF